MQGKHVRGLRTVKYKPPTHAPTVAKDPSVSEKKRSKKKRKDSNNSRKRNRKK